MKRLNHIIETLEREKKQIQRDNERLIIQIDTCDHMINQYNEKLKENDEKIKSIEHVLYML